MASFRVFYRLLSILVLTLFLYSSYLLMGIALMGRKQSWLSLGNKMQSLWARWVSRIIGMRIKAQGPLPEKPFLLVSNHLGYIDILLLAACTRVVFVSKKEVANWPLLGRMANSVGTIFIDRGSKRAILKVNQLIEQAIKQGKSIVVFAEGTSSDGTRVLPLKPSLLNVACNLSLPVNAAAIAYKTTDSNQPASQSICWWGDMTFGPHFIGLLRLKNFSAHISFSQAKISGSDRKQLADSLYSEINRLHLAIS